MTSLLHMPTYQANLASNNWDLLKLKLKLKIEKVSPGGEASDICMCLLNPYKDISYSIFFSTRMYKILIDSNACNMSIIYKFYIYDLINFNKTL